MLQRRTRRLARQGFTLIELMIVIAIIGVLAAIAVPNFQAARQRANVRACYANQKTIAGAIEMYNLDFNQSLTTLDGTLLTKLKTEGYLQSVPNDPGKGQTNTYALIAVDGNWGLSCVGNHGPIQDSGTTATP